MEHNQLWKLLIPVMQCETVDQHIAAKETAFRFVYGIVMRVIDAPQRDIPEDAKAFLARTLGESGSQRPPKRTPTIMARISNYLTSDTRKEIVALRRRTELLEEMLRKAGIVVPAP